MFRIESTPNPLDALVAGTGTAFVQNKLAQQAEQQRMQKFQRATQGLDENSSDISWFKALNNVPKEDRADFLKIHENVSKGKKGKAEAQREQMEKLEKGEADKESIATIESAFGPTAAKVWKASSTGGRTELLKTMLDAKLRGEDVNNLLSSANIQDGESPEMINAAAQSAVTGEFKYPKLDTYAGLKPSEKPSYRENRRKENLPKFDDALKSIKSAETEERYINILEDINDSGKLPEGLGRIIINPETKMPYGIAELTGQVNAETQRWIKTINDFTTRAKDSFPGRVTNFDLQTFMSRLPGLLNTPEGRGVILQQMRIGNHINALYDRALKDVYHHYGADKITPEEANQIAERKIETEKAALEEKMISLGKASDALYNREVESSQRGGRGKTVTMYTPDGEPLDVPENEVQELLKAGAVIR